jgi:hypothetical protein
VFIFDSFSRRRIPFVLRKREKVKRELFASSSKSLFYVIAIQEHLKQPSMKRIDRMVRETAHK